MKSIFYLFLIANLSAWDGKDANRGNDIEIEAGNLVREDEEIEYYEYGKRYGTLNVQSIEDNGYSVEIEGIDEDGELRTFEMEK